MHGTVQTEEREKGEEEEGRRKKKKKKGEEKGEPTALPIPSWAQLEHFSWLN